MSARLLVTAALLALGLLATASASCVGQNADMMYACPSESVFTGRDASCKVLPGSPTGVSEYMARRCGTLDCHGSSVRPMRLYGSYGLRQGGDCDPPSPPGVPATTGGCATTCAELKANYGAVCSVEPEATDQAVTNQGVSADKLLVVLKARGTEAHKGGAVVAVGSKGDECITGWLKGDDAATVAAACQAALAGL